jgi:hypothetical protein
MNALLNSNNMSLFRKFFLGINKTESRKYIEVMKNIQPADLPEEEWQRLASMFRRGFLIKLVAIPSAVALGYFIPLPPDLGYPTFTRYFIGMVGYRAFILQPNSQIYDAVKEVVNKYDLENVIYNRLKSEGEVKDKGESNSPDQRMGDIKDEALEGIKEAEGKSQKDNADPKTKPAGIDTKAEQGLGDEKVDAIKDAEKGPGTK